MSAPLSYWACGGDICVSRQAISIADAYDLLAVHLDEARAAIAADATQTALRALSQASDLSAAFRRAHDWRLASGWGL